MEKGGQQANENRHCLDFGNDPSHKLWNNQEDAIEDRLGDEGYAHTDPEDEDYVPECKPSKPVKRKRLTPQQTQELMAVYGTCTHPDAEKLEALGTKIGLEPCRVKVWFQNRRPQMKKKAQVEQNKQIQQENASLLAENQSLRQAMLIQSCITCGGKTLPSDPLAEKQRLLIENTRLQDECLRASVVHGKIIHTSAFTKPAPWIISSGVDREALRRHADTSMEQFLVLATKGEPMWLPTTDSEMLNYEYGARMSPCLFGLRPEGFVVEATRDTAMVWGTATDLVGILMDTARWSETFPGVVASVVAGDFVSTGIFASCDGQIQLMNAELWVQSPRVPNRTVNILRFSKLVDEKQWAVMDVSVDGILGREVTPARYMGCRLLPSGCLIKDLSNGYCKVTWIVHVEYDETTVPMMFKPLFLTGQALGARRWLASLQRQCEYAAALHSSRDLGNNNTGILKLAQQMMASFYTAVSGPVTQTQATSNINEWFGSMGTGVERPDAPVRMVTWRKAGTASGEPADLVLSATTTLWLPSTPPERVFDYLRNEKLRGEWDMLTIDTAVKELGYIATGHPGNVVSVLCSNITDGTKNKMLILQEARTDVSGSLVVYAPIRENTMHAVMNSGNNTFVSFLPSGFAILPDGHGKASQALVTAASTSRAPVCRHNNTEGSLLTMAYQVLLPDNLTAGAMDDVGKLICHAINKIKTAVKADIILPA